MSSPKPLLVLLALLLSVALQTLALPPLSLVVFHPIAFVPALFVLPRYRGWRAFFLGWTFGFLLEVVTFWSLVPTLQAFVGIPLLIALAIQTLFGLVFGLHLGFFALCLGPLRRVAGAWWPLAWAASFTALEFLNPLLFTYYQGSLWFRQSWVFLLVSLTGQAGVSYLVLLWNMLFLVLLERWRARRQIDGGGEDLLLSRAALRRTAIVALSMLLFAVLWSLVRLQVVTRSEQDAPTTRIALIQANQSVDRHFDMSAAEIVNEHVALSREVLRDHGPIDVFIWPEGAITGTPSSESNRPMLALVEESGAELWTGASRTSKGEGGKKTQYNSAYRLYKAGEPDKRYDKNILLPFGEYMPLEGLFPFLGKVPGVGRYKPGEGVVVYDAPKARFIFLICYEAVRSAYVRQGARQDINLLVNISYDGWFGKTFAPHQHLMMSALQAAQYGVPMARSATTGVSAFVDARGRILEQTELFTRDALVRDLKIHRVGSPYTLLGDWFAWGCVLVTLALLGKAAWVRIGASRAERL